MTRKKDPSNGIGHAAMRGAFLPSDKGGTPVHAVWNWVKAWPFTSTAFPC